MKILKKWKGTCRIWKKINELWTKRLKKEHSRYAFGINVLGWKSRKKNEIVNKYETRVYGRIWKIGVGPGINLFDIYWKIQKPRLFGTSIGYL